MKKIVISFLKYYLFWLFFFTAFKIFFVGYNYSKVSDVPASDFWGIFSHGVIMDLSVAGYVSLLPGLIFSFGFLYTSKICTQLLKYYTLIILIGMTWLGLSDVGLYQPWGSRLNAQFLMYLKTPGGMIASLNWWQLILFPSLWFGIVYLFFKVYKKLFPDKVLRKISAQWYTFPAVLVLTAALIIPIRGGFDRSPLNHSSVYFSEHLTANQCAYNYFWNLMHSIKRNKQAELVVNYMDAEEAERIVSTNYKPGQKAPQLIFPGEGQATNIILLFLESFSNKIIEPLGGLPGVTPRLNEFCEEGIAFNSFFATGNRSDKGMSAFIGGHPSDMTNTTPLSFPEKLHKLNYLPRYFADDGYQMSFYYGGDVNFYNTRAVMLNSGINNIIAKEDFPLELGLIQKWGVPDEYLYQRAFQDLKAEKQPFFSMIYNISSHEPFDVEGSQKFPGSDMESKYLNAAAYADSCLGIFIDSLRNTPLWNNTLVVITSDHTSLWPGPSNITEPSTYRVPLILLGGVIKEHQLIERFGNHNDFGPMLLKQLGRTPKEDVLSKDFLVDGNYAFYFRQEGWAYLSPEMAWFYNTDTQMQDVFYNTVPEKTDSVMRFAQAYVQFLHSNPLNRK